MIIVSPVNSRTTAATRTDRTNEKITSRVANANDEYMSQRPRRMRRARAASVSAPASAPMPTNVSR